MDSTVITTSLPAIAVDIGENPLALKLALTSYLVSLAVFIPISGWVADRYGSRSVFMTAIVVFIGGSLLCAVSNSLPAFVISRFLQGMGGAMMVPVGRLVIMRAVPKRDYVAALNYLPIPALMGPVIGPALGGDITLFFYWRWIFIINSPIGLLGLFWCIASSRICASPRYRRSIGAASPYPGRPVCVDARVSALGGHLLPTWATAASIVGGTVVLYAYVLHARRTEHPSLDLRLFRSPTFFNGVAAEAFPHRVGATPFLLPLLLQLGFGLNPLQSGLLTGDGDRRDVHEDAHRDDPEALGIPYRPHDQRAPRRDQRGDLRILQFDDANVVIVLVLLVSGCLRSLQPRLQALSHFTAAAAANGQTTSIASMTQRLSQSLGIAIGAYALELSSLAQGHASIVAADFPPAFIAIGVLAALSALFHRRLARSAGTEVSGHSQE